MKNSNASQKLSVMKSSVSNFNVQNVNQGTVLITWRENQGTVLITW